MASRTTKRMFIMLALVVLIIAALAFGKFLQIKQLIASQPKPQPQVVSTIVAGRQEWQPQVNAVGTLVALRGVDLASEVTGLVRQVGFKSGQDTKAGALLVQLNADVEIAQLRSLQVAVDLAAKVLARDREQFAVKAVSQAQIDADESDLKAKQANLAQQRALIDKKTVRAPFSGRLGISTINPGQYLNTGDKIVTLQKLDPMLVDFNVPQGQLESIRIGQRLKVSGDGVAGAGFEGRITAINPKVDPATRNVQVEATVANPKLQLLPGMFARVDVDSGAKQSNLTLPQAAITFNPYGATVFVVEPGSPPKVKQVFVTTGPTRGDQVAVLSGVKEGEQIVTSGQLKLKNGTEIKVDNRNQPANDANPTPQEK